MKREVGTSAGVLALIALVLHTQFRPAKEAATETESTAQAERARRQPREEQEERREGPWVATRAFFQKGEPPALAHAGAAAPSFESPCSPDPDLSLPCLIEPRAWDSRRSEQLQSFMGLEAPDRYRIWSIVATMADPSHTRLPLFFDRQVEAVTRALQPHGFELAGQWMPWADRSDATEPDISERRRQKRMQREQEEIPGILIFRRFSEKVERDAAGYPKREALFVWVVPEMPTDGVSGPAFFAALRLAQALTTEKIGYLAPSFSGSFESLAALVGRWNRSEGPAAEKIAGTFYSGTASSAIVSRLFMHRAGVSLKSGIASSQDLDAAFCTVLSRYGLEAGDAAYLVEDETGFSAHDFTDPTLPHNAQIIADAKDPTQQPKCSPPRYVFPRDISHLRNVYQQEAPNGTERGRSSIPGVSFSVKDPNIGEDSVPTFSDAQTPLSQNAVVHSIMDEFRRRRVRLVYIVATNVLDTLFLAQIVQEASPDTRVLTEDPDVLFIAAASQTPLSGAVFLSSYPMFFEGERWLRPDGSAQRTYFSSPDFEGLYNCTQAVLADIGAIGKAEAVTSLRGYAQLDRDNPQRAHPGLWLLTLNHSGFAPIDLMDEGHPNGTDAHSDWFALAAEAEAARVIKAANEPEFPSPPRGWFVTALITTAFALWGCWLTVRANRGERCWPVWVSLGSERIRRAIGPNEKNGTPPRTRWLSMILDTPRLVALSGALLAVSASEFILFLPAWLSSFEARRAWPEIVHAGLDMAGFAGFAAPPVVGIWLWRGRRPRACTYDAGIYAGIEIAVYLTFLFVWGRSCWLYSPAAVFFRFRAIELYSGSSPALPLYLLAIVMLLGSLFYLKRFSRAGYARPCLELGGVQSLSRSLRRSYRAINSRIMGPAAVRLAYCVPKAVPDLKSVVPGGHEKENQERRRELRRRAAKTLGRDLPALVILGIAILLLQPWRYASAFEQRHYNVAISIPVIVLLFCLTLATYDLARIWMDLEKFIGYIDLIVPLRGAFKRVAREWPRRPIWASNQRLPKQSLARQMLTALHNRRVALGTGLEGEEARWDVQAFWDSIPSRFDAVEAERGPSPQTAVAVAAGATGGSAAPQIQTPPDNWPFNWRYVRMGGSSLAKEDERRLPEPASDVERFLSARRRHEKVSATLMDRIITTDLIPRWRKNVIEDSSEARFREQANHQEDEEQQLKRWSTDFVALQFTKYLIYVVGQIQAIAWCISFGLLMLIVVLNSYSPQSPLLVGRFLAALLLIIGVVVFWVFAGMERNAILSHISGTQPGKLNQEFWVQLIGMGILPLIAVLSHLFPSISNFLFSWVGSGVESTH